MIPPRHRASAGDCGLRWRGDHPSPPPAVLQWLLSRVSNSTSTPSSSTRTTRTTPAISCLSRPCRSKSRFRIFRASHVTGTSSCVSPVPLERLDGAQRDRRHLIPLLFQLGFQLVRCGTKVLHLVVVLIRPTRPRPPPPRGELHSPSRRSLRAVAHNRALCHLRQRSRGLRPLCVRTRGP